MRDWTMHSTVLSGDIGAAGSADNTYHVVMATDISDQTLLDGFIIQDGNADGIDTITVNGYEILNANGAGMYNVASSQMLMNVVINKNKAFLQGGGMYNMNASPMLINTVIDNNLASDNGGGIYNAVSSPTILNTTISNNGAAYYGGGMYNLSSSPVITNSVFGWNVATISDGDDIFDSLSVPIITYTILQEYASGGTGTVLADPDFVNRLDPNGPDDIWMNADDGLVLNLTSPGFNTGLNAAVPVDKTTDIKADMRIQNDTVDMGAYESMRPCNNPDVPIITASQDVICVGSVELHISGDLNEADAWYVYADSCGGTLLGTTTDSVFSVSPSVTTTYYMRGEGNCVLPDTCDSVTVTVLPILSVAHVDHTAVGANDGSSWTDAFTSLQDALFAAYLGCIDTIKVAEGTYMPSDFPPGCSDCTDSRNYAFQIADSVVMLGGYPNGGGVRDWTDNPVILSGDIGTPSNSSDNTYHILIGIDLDNQAIVDGFTIEDGTANAITGSTTVDGNNIPNSDGGGIYLANASPALMHLVFTTNQAMGDGGAMYNSTASPLITNVVFDNNLAFGDGGAIYNMASSPVITNATFNDNSANAGGGVFNNSSSDIIRNSIFWNNVATVSSHFDIEDLASLTTVTYTLLQTYAAGGIGCITGTDPLFVDEDDPDGVDDTWMTPDDGLVLQTISPAINGGLNANIAGFGVDIKNETRIENDTVDMGAYETGVICTPSVIPEVMVSPLEICTGSATLTITGNLNDATAWYIYTGGCGITPFDTITTNALAVSPAVTTTYFVRGEGGCVTPGACGSATVTVNPVSEVLYVDIAAGGSNDGSTWANAFNDLQDALDLAEIGCVDTIKVAQGTYRPTDFPANCTDCSSTRDRAFLLPEGVPLLGGYPTGGAGPRDWGMHPTILSGDIGTPGNNTDNSYHVVISMNLNDNSIFEGFTVQGGNANGTDSITVNGESIPDNSGGGMYNAASSPAIRNVIFTDNFATAQGGGMHNAAFSSANIANVVFYDNTTFGNGGAMSNTSSSPLVTNVTMVGNMAVTGGAIFNDNASPTIRNSIIWDNMAVSASDIGNIASTPTLSHSLLQAFGGCGTCIVGQSPIFVDSTDANGPDNIWMSADDGLSLLYGSPAINAALNVNLPSDITEDVRGNDRIINSTVDMGAYEFDYTFPCGQYSTLVIDDVPVYPAIYQAEIIISAGLVNTGIVRYEAEMEINLLPGFEVELGPGFIEFEALIESPCTD